MRRRSRDSWVATVVVSILLTGCGSAVGGIHNDNSRSSIASGNGSSSGPASFLSRASNAAIFVQWTRSGNQLTGELLQALLQSDSSGKQSISDQSVAFTGTMSGSSLTLSLNEGLGSVINLTGTLQGGELNLNYPGRNGGLTTLQMQPAAASDYNAAVANLQGEARQANSQAQAAQAARLRAQQVQGDSQAVIDDLSNLQSVVSAASGTSSLDSDLAQVQKDLGQTLSDEQKVLGEVGHTDSGTLCGDAATVSGDASSVQGDYSTIQGDQSSVDGDQSSISAAIDQLKQDAATLDADRANDPGDVPADAPSDAQVATAIEAARAKIASENAATGGALSQAQGMLNTANAYASKAQAACNAAGG